MLSESLAVRINMDKKRGNQSSIMGTEQSGREQSLPIGLEPCKACKQDRQCTTHVCDNGRCAWVRGEAALCTTVVSRNAEETFEGCAAGYTMKERTCRKCDYFHTCGGDFCINSRCAPGMAFRMRCCPSSLEDGYDGNRGDKKQCEKCRHGRECAFGACVDDRCSNNLVMRAHCPTHTGHHNGNRQLLVTLSPFCGICKEHHDCRVGNCLEMNGEKRCADDADARMLCGHKPECADCSNISDCTSGLCKHGKCISSDNPSKCFGGSRMKILPNGMLVIDEQTLRCASCNSSNPCTRWRCIDERCAEDEQDRIKCARKGECETCSSRSECISGLCVRNTCVSEAQPELCFED